MSSAVLDTNVFIAAAFRPKSDSARVVRAIRDGELRLVWDEATRDETRALFRKIPPLAWEDVEWLFLESGKWEGPVDPERFGIVPDPEDRKFAALAAAAGVPLVTLDAHLLDLPEEPGFQGVTPSGFLGG